jgi:hypothetical protein
VMHRGHDALAGGITHRLGSVIDDVGNSRQRDPRSPCHVAHRSVASRHSLSCSTLLFDRFELIMELAAVDNSFRLDDEMGLFDSAFE